VHHKRVRQKNKCNTAKKKEKTREWDRGLPQSCAHHVALKRVGGRGDGKGRGRRPGEGGELEEGPRSSGSNGGEAIRTGQKCPAPSKNWKP